MAGPCPADFERMAAELGGFTCDGAQPIIGLRNPFGLTNWTLPVLEVLVVACAVLALVHAVRRYRAGDRVPMALWWAPVVYLLVIEIPVYFPNLVGAEDTENSMGVVFVHNVFAVEFLWDRLPLYIVAIYPAMTVLAYEVVRAFGVFARRGILAGAVSVGFVHHCFYEVFDHLGPQRSWWLWNTASEANQPAVAAVPANSIFLFATVGPILVTAVILAITRRRDGTGLDTFPRLVGAILCAGIATPIGLIIVGVPGRIAGGGGVQPNVGAQAVVLGLLTVAFLAVGAWFLAGAWLRRADQPLASAAPLVWLSGSAYLAVFALLWAVSLPAYFAAAEGVTASGTLTGSLPYAVACWLVCVLVLAAVRPRGTDGPAQVAVPADSGQGGAE
ncbi:hypothetical protein VST63_18775 [Mycolicibacterium sp. 050232]|uniref:hypothetical protein n=1 Tax=Mycolicibacterium sp. 050232 TaxID=3113982 RepID=UPI002E27B6C4|nr:hypothetical protein [Mycolicibacterium sp. 050232]MED5814408.1 hypothetical protein [Mycolicibacterium sp. 050232]